MSRYSNRITLLRVGTCAFALFVGAGAVRAQVPRINTLFPIGGKAGETVEVEVRGSNLSGAEGVLVAGGGITGSVTPGGNKADDTNKPVWQAKCASCHELRSPGNRSMTPTQWAATVDRMVKVRQAPLSADEATKVTQYLQSAARAGQMTARLTIAPDAMPGLREVRIVTPHGVSTATLFEVGNLPDVMAVPGQLAQPLPVTLPCVANGTVIGNGERHYFKIAAEQGKRYVFNFKAFRYTDVTQTFFNPDLRLYDPKGQELVENHGYYEMDPLIDWTCQQPGDYVLEVRDLLGKGNPGSVYRLAMGSVPYDTVVYPAAGKVGERFTGEVFGQDLVGASKSFTTVAPDHPGLTPVSTPWGPQPFYTSMFPVVTAENGAQPAVVPATFTGRIDKPGATNAFSLRGTGLWEFQVYAERLGASDSLRVDLLGPDGKKRAGTNGDRNFRANLDANQTFQLRVDDAAGKGGEGYVYAVEAHPARAYVEAVARPDSVPLRPGTATLVEVILTRREGVDGDVNVTVAGLPPGVSARPLLIPPDRDRGWLILDASADALAGAKPFVITATAQGGETTYSARCTPQEEYRLYNDRRYVERAYSVVGVGAQPDFSATVTTSGPIKVDPRNGVEVKVKVQRRNGFKGGLVARIDGLPQGWTANQEGLPGDHDEVTLLVRPDGGNQQPFIKRDPKLTPIQAVVQLIEDDVPYVVGVLPVDRPAVVDETKRASR
jgi:hypothetical protein